MKALDADLAQEGGEEESETSNGSAGRGEEKVQKVQKLIYAAKVSNKTTHKHTASINITKDG